MADWKHTLLSVLSDFEDRYDNAKFELQQRLGLGKLCIVPYRGYGTQTILYLKGRVLRDKGITSPMEDDTVWLNLLNMYKRYQSDEIPGARVLARFGDLAQEVVADEEGHFEITFEPPALPTIDGVWHEIELELLDYPGKDKNPEEPQSVTATGYVIVPPADADFGVISDIDDTVLRTDVVNLLAMARNTFLKNARTRLPFAGASAFYDVLRHGSGKHFNPIYYVTSSAWNLYDMIVDFFAVRNIPVGPLFMINMGITDEQFIVPGHHTHKFNTIQTLLDTHPTLPFILIGDSSQKDPEIYLDVIRQNPGRILAVYIRDVTESVRDTEVQAIIAEAVELGVEMIFVEDTFVAAQHAADQGFITDDQLALVLKERNEDKQAPTALEQAIMPESDSAPGQS